MVPKGGEKVRESCLGFSLMNMSVIPSQTSEGSVEPHSAGRDRGACQVRKGGSSTQMISSSRERPLRHCAVVSTLRSFCPACPSDTRKSYSYEIIITRLWILIQGDSTRRMRQATLRWAPVFAANKVPSTALTSVLHCPNFSLSSLWKGQRRFTNLPSYSIWALTTVFQAQVCPAGFLTFGCFNIFTKYFHFLTWSWWHFPSMIRDPLLSICLVTKFTSLLWHKPQSGLLKSTTTTSTGVINLKLAVDCSGHQLISLVPECSSSL